MKQYQTVEERVEVTLARIAKRTKTQDRVEAILVVAAAKGWSVVTPNRCRAELVSPKGYHTVSIWLDSFGRLSTVYFDHKRASLVDIERIFRLVPGYCLLCQEEHI